MPIRDWNSSSGSPTTPVSPRLLSAYKGLKLLPNYRKSQKNICLLSAYKGLKQGKDRREPSGMGAGLLSAYKGLKLIIKAKNISMLLLVY